jgi:MerR HTH family regulatory protein
VEDQYISLDEVAKDLGVVQGTLQYYLRELKIKRYKFPLDKKAYITESDLEKIKAVKAQAGKSGKKREGKAKESSAV